MVAIPGHLCVVLASVNLDVDEVEKQLITAAASATGPEQLELLNTALDLRAITTAIGRVLDGQAEIQLRPEGKKP